ncbi:hypothetical protein [Zavarzinia sp. CC-PAN008]|uniref:hypothetical protein n=1 Tax=Zavarzinia sp. CC-PAN008 TaxID=3243332 RepID=UPI003F74AA25
MTLFRALLTRHRWLALWLVCAALAMKVLIPPGFMPGMADGAMVITLCTGQGARIILAPVSGGDDAPARASHQKAEMPCAFAGLSTPALAALDPVLLALLVAYVIARVRAVLPGVRCGRRVALWPPPHGPPAAS